MTKMDGAETVRSKEAFERVASSYGVRIKHYRYDNDLFDNRGELP